MFVDLFCRWIGSITSLLEKHIDAVGRVDHNAATADYRVSGKRGCGFAQKHTVEIVVVILAGRGFVRAVELSAVVISAISVRTVFHFERFVAVLGEREDLLYLSVAEFVERGGSVVYFRNGGYTIIVLTDRRNKEVFGKTTLFVFRRTDKSRLSAVIVNDLLGRIDEVRTGFFERADCVFGVRFYFFEFLVINVNVTVVVRDRKVISVYGVKQVFRLIPDEFKRIADFAVVADNENFVVVEVYGFVLRFESETDVLDARGISVERIGRGRSGVNVGEQIVEFDLFLRSFKRID